MDKGMDLHSRFSPAEQEETMEVRKLREWDEKETRERFMEIKGGKGYTIADIEALPEGERAELIDGEMFRMDSPMRTHQKILMKLAFEIELYIRNHKGSCEVYPAPFAVYIKKDNRNYVEPDILVICDEDRLDEKGCHGAPDWAVEIVSPTSIRMDYERKVKLYREAGVREYWIVDPGERTVEVYLFAENEEKKYTFEEMVPVGIYEDFAIDFRAFQKFFKTS